MDQELSPPYEFIAAMLRTPISVVEVTRKVFEPGHVVSDEVVMTNRCILVLKGAMEYEVERVKTPVEASVQLLVPNWVRRTWRTIGGCEIFWVDFATHSLDLSPSCLFSCQPRSFSLERDTLTRMAKVGRSERSRNMPENLALEGEIKAMLGRFWAGAQATRRDGFAGTHFAESLHPEIRRAAVWLSEHFSEPEALSAFYKTLLLSPDYFRRQFQAAYGENMQSRLNRIRLRHARFLVHESSLSLKEVAAECGFSDPLFFSRQYRKFWGAAPSVDRSKGH